MVFSRHTEKAVFHLSSISRQNESVHRDLLIFLQQNHLLNFGVEILSKSGLEAVANDKDGGYSMVDPEVLTNIHLQLLGNGQYFETD